MARIVWISVAVVSLFGCGRGSHESGPTEQLEAPDLLLTGRAELPADTFIEGPVSGQFIETANGRTTPFEGQPVQGFSALLANEDGSFLALADNGFGSKRNSADYLLTVYRVQVEFAADGQGSANARPEFVLSDPDGHIAWPIVADSTHYPGSDVRVDPSIVSGRLLTGADFDVESFRRVADGTFFFGDEFGPFLLHTDAEGRLVEPPIGLPGVWSPEHPDRGGHAPNLPSSAGFEGMALSGSERFLYPMLEKPLIGADTSLILIFQFDVESGRYLSPGPHLPAFRYRFARGAQYATEFVHLEGDRYLVVERDPGQGPTAQLKKVFEVDLTRVYSDGVLEKTERLDLLSIQDPNGIGGYGTGTYSFPYETTEALAVLDETTWVIVNDNNYPFGLGRYWEEGEPDGTEFIRVGDR